MITSDVFKWVLAVETITTYDFYSSKTGKAILGGNIQTNIFSEVMEGRLKMRDMKMRDQFARVGNAGKVSMESQSVKKCLKVVVFVCRVIPSV